MITDGGLKGDGPIKCSFNTPGKDIAKLNYNLSFKEARATVETSFARVANWFSILGNNKARLNYSHKTTMLTIHAASKLHYTIGFSIRIQIQKTYLSLIIN